MVHSAETASEDLLKAVTLTKDVWCWLWIDSGGKYKLSKEFLTNDVDGTGY